MANKQSVFDAYDHVTPIGSGGMAHVYRARDRRAGRDVAIKILPQKHSPDAPFRFQREARIAAMVRHPRIAAVYDGANYLGLISNQDIVEAFSVQTFVERQKQMRQMPANM